MYSEHQTFSIEWFKKFTANLICSLGRFREKNHCCFFQLNFYERFSASILPIKGLYVFSFPVTLKMTQRN